MVNEVYVVVEYNPFIDSPTEYIVGVFSTRWGAEQEVENINNWYSKDCVELRAKVVASTFDQFST